MKNATRRLISSMGVIMALAGFEHGLGEALQGSHPPAGLVILSWPDSEFYRVLGGEPAMTVIPNLLVSGLLTMLVSLIILVWVVGFIHRRRAALVLAGLSVVLLLIGGGFGPPLLGFVLSAGAARINAPASEPGDGSLRRFLGDAWLWIWGACLAVWIFLLAGLSALNLLAPLEGEMLVPIVTLCAFIFLALAMVSAQARDGRRGTY